MATHKQITFEGRSYNYDPDCACAGCESLRRYPEPTKCDWCKTTHCGGADHCSTQVDGRSGEVLGAGEADSTISEKFLEDVCGIIRDRIAMITQTVKEMNETMIPKYQGETTNEPASTSTGGRRSTTKKRDGFDFLKTDDLSKDAKTAKILACRVQPDNFNKSQKVVMVKLSLDGQIKMWPIRLNNPSLEVLSGAFGSDENDWVDKKIGLFVTEDEFDGRRFIAVEPAREEKKNKR